MESYMATILRMTDRINLKIDEVTFIIAPLSYQRKQELASCTKIVNGEEHFDLLKSQALYIKYSLKDVKGITDVDGKDYELQFEGDCLTDDCVSEILSLEQREKLNIASWQLLNGLNDLKDPVTGDKLEGVELEVLSQGK